VKLPKQIKSEIDQFVIGNEFAKKQLSVAGYNHLKRLSGINVKKTNALIIGPSGCGKTYMVDVLAKILKVPFFSADATQFSSTGYQGRKVEDLVSGVVELCDGNKWKAERSIIYLDEIDKLKSKNLNGQSDISGTAVQQSLLKIIEGSEISYASKMSEDGKHDSSLNTSNIMFICSGAFVGITDSSIESLNKYGMILEFIGRFSMIAKLENLTLEDLKKVMKVSKGSILDNYVEWFKSESVNMIIDDSAVNLIAESAIDRGTGARGLHQILEESLINAQFELPSMKIKPKNLILDSDVVLSKVPKWEF
jgi:ATP-dependent Clp protease ATP-binding subunit ClpX